jgi:DNA-3-methyladenine glycosylase
MSSTLPREFYLKETREVAKKLLGKVLVRETKGGFMRGKIVETEAYYGENDPASHAFRGRKTKRNEVMWGKPGKAYVYFTYGMHFLLNIVTEEEGKPRAVLIRALEPLEGIEIMKKNRKISNMSNTENLTNGPAKLTQAFCITSKENKADVTSPREKLRIEFGENVPERNIIAARRIGIIKGKEKELRFYIKGNKFVSKY